MINICFHGIGTPARDREPGEDHYWISIDAYRRALDEIASWPDISISFDDGNESDLSIGVPELTTRGMSATFFVVAGRIGSAGSLDVPALRALIAAGMRVGSHGMHHRPWTHLDDADLRVELVDAREQIESAVTTRVTDVALPLGRYDRRVLGAVRRHQYDRVYSSDQAPARARSWFQARYSVTCDDTPETLRRRVLERQGTAHHARGYANALRKRIR